jgi:prepilin-type N-terminal cleavage/methylation domain-containing protein
MRGRAFTLVELLVTVAVIGILLGIAVPSVGAIRREARNAGCLSHLRQDFVAIDAYRQQNAGRLPICEFLPVVTDAGIDGGLPRYLAGYMPEDSPSWLCPADLDEESLSTGTSYLYLPGLLRFAPAVQAQVVGILMSGGPGSTPAELEARRRDAESTAMTGFFEREGNRYALLADSQDRHPRSGSLRNGVYVDGSARVSFRPREDPQVLEEAGIGPGGGAGGAP